MNSRIGLAVICALFAFAPAGSADSVIFDDDFSELPAGWYASTFEFGSQGAYIDRFTYSGFDANLATGGIPVEYIIFVPDGADSVRIEIPYTLQASGSYGPSMEFKILLGTQSVTCTTVWEAIISFSNPQIYESGTLVFTPDWIHAGDFIGIYFRADIINPGEDGGTVRWYIHNLKMTAFGDDLAMDQSTWGSIKTLF